MPTRAFSASTYVAAQTKNIRKRRQWSQQRLADRLTELVTGTPPEIYEEEDPRRRPAELRARQRKWTQSRVAKLERGALKCVSIDDVLELALALDVSPLVLITPTLEPNDRENDWSLLQPGENDVFLVSLGRDTDIAYWPRNMRQWIRGAKPLLGSTSYATDEEAVSGHRFYARMQPAGELGEDAKKAKELRRVWRPVEELMALHDEEQADAE